jgi:hypothetical protein
MPSLFPAAPALESKLNGYHWTLLTRTCRRAQRRRARSTWVEDAASRRGYALAASHSPDASDRAGHRDASAMPRPASVCSSATGGACVWEPPVLLLDSSGAIGGVLELPGDDYFISTAEVQVSGA